MRKIEFVDAEQNVRGSTFVAVGEDVTAHVPYYDSAVSWREVDPVVVAAELKARADEDHLQDAVRRGTVLVLLNYENRIRALEGRPAITVDQFKAALRTILGI